MREALLTMNPALLGAIGQEAVTIDKGHLYARVEVSEATWNSDRYDVLVDREIDAVLEDLGDYIANRPRGWMAEEQVAEMAAFRERLRAAFKQVLEETWDVPEGAAESGSS